MDKDLCLQLFQISAALPPIYTHPYHKLDFPRRKIEPKSIDAKIAKLSRIKNLVINSQAYRPKKHKYKSTIPRMKFSIVEKQSDKCSRPLTSQTGPPFVYLNMTHSMLTWFPSQDKPSLHVRGNSIS